MRDIYAGTASLATTTLSIVDAMLFTIERLWSQDKCRKTLCCFFPRGSGLGSGREQLPLLLAAEAEPE